jgi:hypothetical protein
LLFEPLLGAEVLGFLAPHNIKAAGYACARDARNDPGWAGAKLMQWLAVLGKLSD